MRQGQKDSVTRFSTIFCLKDSTWAPYEQAKTVLLFFVEETCVRVVKDFADTHEILYFGKSKKLKQM